MKIHTEYYKLTAPYPKFRIATDGGSFVLSIGKNYFRISLLHIDKDGIERPILSKPYTA